MSFFFCPVELEVGTPVVLDGDTAHHIGTVRRMKPGEELELQDPRGARFSARVEAVVKRSLTILPLAAAPIPAPARASITLLQALISEQNLDLILQKATELGAVKVVLFPAEHSPHRLVDDRLAHKTDRWNQIIRNACEQSGRPVPTELIVTDSLEDALAHRGGTVILLDEHGSSTHTSEDSTLIVGPEGGLTDSEKALAHDVGATTMAVGPYTLRSETAAIAGMTICIASRA